MSEQRDSANLLVIITMIQPPKAESIHEIFKQTIAENLSSSPKDSTYY